MYSGSLEVSSLVEEDSWKIANGRSFGFEEINLWKGTVRAIFQGMQDIEDQRSFVRTRLKIIPARSVINAKGAV